MLQKIKKHLASINLTIFATACVLGVWKGIDPCDQTMKHFMSLAGISDMFADVEDVPPEGPPLVKDFEIVLNDGRVISVLANGTIVVRGE